MILFKVYKIKCNNSHSIYLFELLNLKEEHSMDSLASSDVEYIKRLSANIITILNVSSQNIIGETRDSSKSLFELSVGHVKNTINARSHLSKLLGIEQGKIENISFRLPCYPQTPGIHMYIKIWSVNTNVSDRHYTKFIYKKHRPIILKQSDIQEILQNVCIDNNLLKKNDFKLIHSIFTVIHNYTEFIPKFEIEVSSWNKIEGYILQVENIMEMDLSFLEYLYNLYEMNIHDIELQQITGETSYTNILRIYVKSYKHDGIPMGCFKREISQSEKLKNHGISSVSSEFEDTVQPNKKTKMY